MVRLSIIVLTRNEAANIGPLFDAIARQKATRAVATGPGETPGHIEAAGDGDAAREVEVVVVDAASTDGTVAAARVAAAGMPFPVRIDASRRRLPFGEARNRGLAACRARHVAFLSADAVPADDWVATALGALAHHDVVYGRQVHAPRRWTWAACVRGLRYHYPDHDADGAAYASHVAAAYRRRVLEAFPFDDHAEAAEDLLIAGRAAAAGLRVRYEPRLVVHHHDVETWRAEWRKNAREGHAWGLHARDLGIHNETLAWGAGLAACVALVSFAPVTGAAALAAVLWAPAARRAVRRRHAMPARRILQGVAASPPFDVLFLVHYLRGLTAAAVRRRARTDRAPPRPRRNDDDRPTPTARLAEGPR